MDGSFRLRAVQVAVAVVGVLLLIVAGLGMLYWRFMPEINLFGFVKRFWPYLLLQHVLSASEFLAL